MLEKAQCLTGIIGDGLGMEREREYFRKRKQDEQRCPMYVHQLRFNCLFSLLSGSSHFCIHDLTWKSELFRITTLNLSPGSPSAFCSQFFIP